MPITDYYVTTDAMGSVTAILDEEGNVVERRSYDAFGAMTCMTPDGTPATTSPTALDVGFQGQQMDELTGMYQMGYRWYSPVLGRWVSRDPIGLESGMNPMAFVENQPNISKDSSGLWKEIERTGKTWAKVCAEKCDTWKKLADIIGLDADEAKIWVKQFDESPLAGKCYEIPNTIFMYNSEDRKNSVLTPLTFIQDTGLGITDKYRRDLRECSVMFSKLGYCVKFIDNGRTSDSFKEGWNSEGIYEVYFAGHGEESSGAFIAEPNNSDATPVSAKYINSPYKLHAVFALACFTDYCPSWRNLVANGGVFVGFKGYSTWGNREGGIQDRDRFKR
jgi:RHS repeat-associated protein